MKSFKNVPRLVVEVDAYQASHSFVIPEGMKDFQCSQLTFRKPLVEGDHRVICAGLKEFVMNELQTPITQEDIDQADEFYSTFHAHFEPPYYKPYPWPKEIFQRVVDEFNGYLPIVVTGLKSGTAAYISEPVVQVWTDVEGMGELVGWIESTMLPYLWTMSTVATRGRIRKEKFLKLYQRCYPELSKTELEPMIQTRFHDFGRRGGASSQLTGVAHLYNWLGTDTMDSAYVAQYVLNGGKSFGACSINAAAHRSITPWNTEREAYEAHMEHGKGGIYAIVADSYDYFKGVDILCEYADKIKESGSVIVVRPDSGDPLECVLYALEKLEKAFGVTYTNNDNSLKILNQSGVIQGDGVDDDDIEWILGEVIKHGYSPINVAFGMGENNHKALRSDLEACYKTCMVKADTVDGKDYYKPVAKKSNSEFKMSIPEPVMLDINSAFGSPRVFPCSVGSLKAGDTGDLVVHYDGRFPPESGKRLSRHVYDFDETRDRANITWDRLEKKPVNDTISSEIRLTQKTLLSQF